MLKKIFKIIGVFILLLIITLFAALYFSGPDQSKKIARPSMPK
jgi:uncharacterized BrkB/YihY/UPF0761 family membrane protein